MTHDEYDVAAGIGIGTELAARTRAHHDLPIVRDRVGTPYDVVGRCAELAHLASLSLAV